jgi:Chaperone of endosialidase
MTISNSINIQSFTGLVKNSSASNILIQAIAGTDYYSPGNPTYLIDDYSLSGGTYYGNVGVGTRTFLSLVLNSTANSKNTGMGIGAFSSLTVGSNNAAFGYGAGHAYSTYNSCSLFGSLADVLGNNLTNATAIGYSATVAASNTIVLGNTSVTTCNIPGINFGFTANTIESTNTNGNIVLTPNGTGIISHSSNTALGGTTANSALQFANATNYRTLTLFEVMNNSYQYYGFGIQSSTLVYNVPAVTNIHAFYAGTSSSASNELMRITATGTTSNSGCIGINVGATPSAGCHVIGGVQNVSSEDTCFRAQSSSNCAKMEFDSTSSSGRLYEVRSTNTGTWDIVDRTGSAEKLVINTTGVGIAAAPDTNFSVTTGTADKPGGGTWASFSDRRIKEVLSAYKHGLNEILQINPINYRYSEASELRKEDQEVVRIGIIAQDIEEILPECITKMEAKGFEDLRLYDESPLTYALINAIKELNAKITILEKKRK